MTVELLLEYNAVSYRIGTRWGNIELLEKKMEMGLGQCYYGATMGDGITPGFRVTLNLDLPPTLY